MKPSPLFSVTVLGTVLVLSSGCASRAELERVRREQREIRALVADQNVAIEGLRRRLDILRQEMSEPQRTRPGQVSPQLQQRVNELDARLTTLEQRLAVGVGIPPAASGGEPPVGQDLPSAVPAPAPPPRARSPLELAVAKEEAAMGGASVALEYRDGLGLVRQGQCAQAAVRLREFIRKNPKSDLADNAQYWIGACYFFQKDYGPAARELSDVMLRYPKGDKVPAALLLLADAFAASGETTDAKLVLRKLMTEYPRTEEAEEAKQKLRDLGN